MNTVTLREIATDAKVPESTLRLYRDAFEEFLPTVGAGRRRRYGPESAERLTQIARWKCDGLTAMQIRDALTQKAAPVAKARRITQEDRLDELVALVRAQTAELAMLRAELGALRRSLHEPKTEVRTYDDALVRQAAHRQEG